MAKNFATNFFYKEMCMKKTFAVFVAVVLLFGAFVSCNVGGIGGANGITIVEKDISSPELLGLNVVDGKNLQLDFSKAVQAQSIQIAEIDEDDDTDEESILFRTFAKPIQTSFSSLQTSSLGVSLADKTQNGRLYGLRGTVLDASGNSLTFASYFKGYNENVPKMIISEVQLKYTKPKAEFVEIYIQSDGNLGGVCLYTAHGGDKGRYEFPSIDVKKGEYITVHFRKIEENCVDELGSDLNKSGGEYSSSARDLWILNNEKLINKTDVILIEKNKNGKILDALLLAESACSSWSKDTQKKAVERALKDGKWVGDGSVASAVCSDGFTATRTLSRQGALDVAGASSKNDWIVTVKSGATPGEPNSTKVYVP